MAILALHIWTARSFVYAGIDRCLEGGDYEDEGERRWDTGSRVIPVTQTITNQIR